MAEVTDNDIKILESRVRFLGHPDLEGAMYLACTNEAVSKHNRYRLNEIEGQLITIEAINVLSSSKHFHPFVG